jgi:16S rRNA processing protein RimM
MSESEEDSSEESPPPVVVGKFGRAHGIRGEMRLWPNDLHSEILVPGQRLLVLGAGGREPLEVTIERIRPHKRFFITAFEETDDRNDVEEWRNLEVAVPYEDLPELGEDEFYQGDLIGLEVVAPLEEGEGAELERIGEVAGFFETGAHEVMVVEEPQTDEPRLLVPVVEHAVEYVDLEEGRVMLRPLATWMAPEDVEERSARRESRGGGEPG